MLPEVVDEGGRWLVVSSSPSLSSSRPWRGRVRGGRARRRKAEREGGIGRGVARVGFGCAYRG